MIITKYETEEAIRQADKLLVGKGQFSRDKVEIEARTLLILTRVAKGGYFSNQVESASGCESPTDYQIRD